MTDFIAREKIPEVYNNKKSNKPNVILSKYLIKIVFGKWSSDLEFKNTLLNFEFNSQDKVVGSSFTIPTDWLLKLMDFVGTKANPILKAIKFWVYQPESLGIVSSIKLSLKNFKNPNSFIYIDSIEVSKVSDDKIQVVGIQKNVQFTGGPKALNIDLGFKPNGKIIPYDGYTPYLSFCDYFYFYIIYLDVGYLLLSFFQVDLIGISSTLLKLFVNGLIYCVFCTFFILSIAIFYLIVIKSKLSHRHNSEAFQAINVIFLASLYIFVFVLNYLVCESFTNFDEKKNEFLYELGILQLLFPITFLCLWLLNKITKHRAMSKMIIKTGDQETGSMQIASDDKVGSIRSVNPLSNTVSKGLSDGKEVKALKSGSPKVSKILSKKSTLTAKHSLTPIIKQKSIHSVKETPLKRVDSDNSIGSGYYHQMITATKHVRSISQYGELLRDNKY